MLTWTAVIGASEKAKTLLKSTPSTPRRQLPLPRSRPDGRRETGSLRRPQTDLTCVDLRTRPSGSAPGCMYCASLGLVTSTAGHCSNLRSAKLSRSWSTARTLYLQTADSAA